MRRTLPLKVHLLLLLFLLLLRGRLLGRGRGLVELVLLKLLLRGLAELGVDLELLWGRGLLLKLLLWLRGRGLLLRGWLELLLGSGTGWSMRRWLLLVELNLLVLAPEALLLWWPLRRPLRRPLWWSLARWAGREVVVPLCVELRLARVLVERILCSVSLVLTH